MGPEQIITVGPNQVSTLNRGSDALKVEIALRDDWKRLKRPSKVQISEHRDEIESIKALAVEYSAWIKSHPSPDKEILKSEAAQHRGSSIEEKVAFMKKFRDDQISRLDHDIPEFEEIVNRLESSAQRLKEIVSSERRR